MKKVTKSLVTNVVSRLSYKEIMYKIVGRFWMTVSDLDKGKHKSLRHGSHLCEIYNRHWSFKNAHTVNIVTFHEVSVQCVLSVQTIIGPMQWNHILWPLHSINYNAILHGLKKRGMVCHLRQSHAIAQRAVLQ
jgi:hypothetical protein